MPRRPAAAPASLALAALVLVASCAAPPEPPRAAAPSPRGFVEHARLADGIPQGSTDVLWHQMVGIGGEMRPALSSARTMVITGAWAADGGPYADATLPPGIGATSTVVGKVAGVGGTGWLSDDLVVGERDPRTTQVRFGPFEPSVRETYSGVIAAVSIVPDVTLRDLVSASVDVPAGAVLDVAFGVEEVGWPAGSPAVEFTVVADDGTVEHPIMRATLDPARVAGDRRWRQVRVPLDALAGRAARFIFAARPVGDGDDSQVVPVWSNPVVLVPATRQLPIGIVLVSLDTLRGPSTSSGGAVAHTGRDTTPWLEREVSGEGVTFDNAITTAPHTLPAHVSLFTGQYLRTHGIRSPMLHIAPEDPTLTEALADAGWVTGAFTEDGFVVPEVGISRGFATYRENKSANLHEPLGFADAIFGAGLEWLATHRDRPFFLFLHTYQVHLPYVPPLPYDQVFDPAILLRKTADLELLRYEQEARYLDDQLAIFLQGLEALGLRERTLLVVTSDHGEEFGEHGQMTHGYQLYDEVARIPLVMRLPGALPAGRRVPAAVSLADVAPTILDLVGLPPLPRADGTSLVPLLVDDAGPFPRESVFAEAISSFLAEKIDVVAYRRANLSCVFHLGAGRTDCFDRRVDPDERNPLRFAEGDARFDRARDEVAAFVQRGEGAPGGTPATGVDDADRFEKLKALGYVGE